MTKEESYTIRATVAGIELTAMELQESVIELLLGKVVTIKIGQYEGKTAPVAQVSLESLESPGELRVCLGLDVMGKGGKDRHILDRLGRNRVYYSLEEVDLGVEQEQEVS